MRLKEGGKNVSDFLIVNNCEHCIARLFCGGFLLSLTLRESFSFFSFLSKLFLAFSFFLSLSALGSSCEFLTRMNELLLERHQ